MTKYEGKKLLFLVAVLVVLLPVLLSLIPVQNNVYANMRTLTLTDYVGKVCLSQYEGYDYIETFYNTSDSFPLNEYDYYIIFEYSNGDYEIGFDGDYTQLIKGLPYDISTYQDISVRKKTVASPTYTVNFNGNGGLLQSGEEVQNIVCGQAATAPVFIKEGYTLSWDKSFENVTENITVTAVWTIKTFIVTFLDWNGAQLKSEIVQYGASAAAPDDPQRESSADYTYIFSGWDNIFENVTENIEVTAQYTQTKNEYIVTFDGNGGLLQSGEEVQNIVCGNAATAPVFIKEGYTLSWDKSFENVTENITVTAVWTIKTYIVTFLDWNGTLLKSETVEYGASATAPDVPQRDSTAEYSYTFSEWNNNFGYVTDDLEVLALYDETTNTFIVNFQNWNGAVLKTETVQYGADATPPTVPERTATAQYTYTFDGWDTGFEKITEDKTVTAQYAATINKYTVTFRNWDEEILAIQTVEYGQAAVAPQIPEKAGASFTAWDKAFDFIIGDLLITAQFSADIYTVSYYIYGDKVFEVSDLLYGDKIVGVFDAEDLLREGEMFLYWEDGNHIQYLLGDEITVNGNLVLSGNTEKIKVYLTLEFNEAETQIIYEYGDTLSTPQPPSCVAGYVFDNWYKDETFSEPFAFGGEIKEDIKIFGRQLPVFYDVEFVIIIAEEDYSYTEKARYGYNVARPETEIEGYSLYWYANEEKSVEYDFSTAITNDTKIYCRAEEKTFAVFIDTSEFEGLETQTVYINYKQSVELPLLEYYGYIHSGYTLVGGGEIFMQMPARNFSVAPTFEARTYCLSFEGAESILGEYLSVVSLPIIEPPEFYYFDGWLDESNAFFESEYKIEGDMSFTPKMTKLRTIMVFCMDTQREYLYGDPVTLETPTQTGHVFLGWYTDENCLQQFNNKAITEEGDELRVYPKWVADSFTLFYSSSAGEGQTTVLYGETAASPETPQFEGYDFCGWFFDAAFTKAFISRTLARDCHIYGKFEKKLFTVRFVGIGGRIIDEQSVPYMEDAVTPAFRECMEEGYGFDGFDGDFLCVTQDITVNAKYTKVYKIVYKDEQGVVLEGAFPPEKAGYSFSGWQAEENEDIIEYFPVYVKLATNPSENIPEEPKEDESKEEPEEAPEEQPIEEEPEETEQPIIPQPETVETTSADSGSYLAIQLLHLKKLSVLDIAFLTTIVFSIGLSVYSIVHSIKKRPF